MLTATRRVFGLLSARKVVTSGAPVARTPGFKPRVEGLEPRDCPATWIGDHGRAADNPNNWLGNVYPADGSDLYFPGLLAGPIQDVDSQGNPVTRYPGGDCDVLHGVWGNIVVGDGYAGTIVMDSSIVAWSLTLSSGTISVYDENTDSDNTLELTSPGVSLIWTGGGFAGRPASEGDEDEGYPFNSSVVLINGGSAVVAPQDAGTVFTGCTLEFVNGATGVFEPGTVDFTGGNGVVINEYCSVALQPAPDAQVRTRRVNAAGSQYHVMPRGYLVVERGPRDPQTGPLVEAELMPVRSEGTFLVQYRAMAIVPGRVQNAPGVASFYQSAGGTSIQSGSVVRAINGFWMSGGVIGFFGGDDQPASTIDGKLTVTGGTIIGGIFFGGTNPSTRYDRFRVIGDISWTGGTYQVFIDGANGDNRSQWTCSGTFTIGPAVTIDIVLISNANNVPADREWKILEGGMGIAGAVVQDNVPGYEMVANNPATTWSLRKS